MKKLLKSVNVIIVAVAFAIGLCISVYESKTDVLSPVQKQIHEEKKVEPKIELSDGTKININTATKEELCTLPGIGESLAERILLHIKKHGKFILTEDIMKVSGIGKSKYEQIKDSICVK